MNLTKNHYKILGHLMRGPCSGYDIKKLLNKIAFLYGSESNSQIYPSLKKLAEQGYIDIKDDSGNGNRPKKIYEITTRGKEELLYWLSEIEQPDAYRNPSMAKFSLTDYLNKSELKAQLENYIKVTSERLAVVEDLYENMQAEHVIGKRPESAGILMTLDHYRRVYKAQIAWAKHYL